MTDATIRELCLHASDVIARAAHGEQITITRGEKPVAELRAASRPSLPAADLLERWRRVPRVDPAGLRADLEDVLDAEL
jgi:antitoxin (DNA-binding transcriptional repressor) of toxin-antitoxin stability system